MSLMLLAGTATAEDTGFYVGGNVGYSFVEVRDDLDLGDRIEEFDVDDEDFAWKAYAGFQFLPFLAIEGGYVDFGDLGGGSDVLDVDSQLDGWDVFAVGNLPLGPIDVFAKIGLISYDLDVDFDDGLNSDTVKSSGEDLAYGIGAALELGRLSIRAEAEGFDISEVDDLFMLSLGATLQF